jgi:hypothetical protein
VLTLPLLASVLLLFLITASSTSLRMDFSVIKIAVDGATLDGLISAAAQAGRERTNSTTSSVASLGGVVGRAASGGYLTLGIWGWCAASSDSSRYVLAPLHCDHDGVIDCRSACTPSSGWYSMQEDLGQGVG